MGVGKIESKHHILSLKLSAFETMGQVTTICTNKTGILTKNEKKVIEFQLGKPIKKKKGVSAWKGCSKGLHFFGYGR